MVFKIKNKILNPIPESIHVFTHEILPKRIILYSFPNLLFIQMYFNKWKTTYQKPRLHICIEKFQTVSFKKEKQLSLTDTCQGPFSRHVCCCLVSHVSFWDICLQRYRHVTPPLNIRGCSLRAVF